MPGDSILPPDLVEKMANAGKAKSEYSSLQLIVRGIGAGALLAVATALSINAWVMDNTSKIVGDLIFPIGFVTLMFTGTELLTGNMALLPLAVLSGKIRISRIPRAWACVLLGNFIGSVLYGTLFYIINSEVGTSNCSGTLNPSAKKLCSVAEKKTFIYAEMESGRGWALAFVRAIGCNWLVCYGTTMNFTSESAIGRIAAMWLPIFTFFSLGYEHLIVNLFVIPTALMFDAPKVSFSNWILWNFFPVTLGNLVGGLTIAFHHWFMHGKRPIAAMESAPAKTKDEGRWHQDSQIVDIPGVSTGEPSTSIANSL